MIQVGRYKVGAAALSMIVVFIVLSACAVFAAFHQSRPEWPMPLADRILINEGLALLATGVYGIFVHLVLSFIEWSKRKNK